MLHHVLVLLHDMCYIMSHPTTCYIVLCHLLLYYKLDIYDIVNPCIIHYTTLHSTNVICVIPKYIVYHLIVSCCATFYHVISYYTVL